MVSLKADNQLVKCKIANEMGLFGQRKNSIAFKGALALLYFILFGYQLSHKFYQCANSPIRTIKTDQWQCTRNELSSGRGSMYLEHNKVSTLSIDKRYEFNHTFAVPLPATNLRVEYSTKVKQACSEPWCRIPANYVVRPFRGPPSI
jgi:hypothetical protein